MKRFLSILLALILAGCLAACAGGSDGSPAPGDSAGDAPAADRPAGGDRVELVWWTTTDGPAEKYQPAAEALVNEYNETNEHNTHVTVEHIGNNYYEMILTAVSSGNAPDASVGWTAQPMQFGLIGEGLPLNSIVDEWKAQGNPIIEDVDQNMWDFYTAPDGNIYGLPFRYDPRIMTYRMDMFEEAGITEMPATWDEFLDVLRQLKTAFPDKIPFLIAGGQYMAIHDIIGFGANNNVGWFDEDLNPNMTSKEWLEILELFGTMRAEGLISEGSAGYIDKDLEKMYAAGEGAILYLAVPAFVRGTDLEEVSGIMPPLQGWSGTQQQTYAWVNGAYGLAQTDHPEETKAWLKWWSENNITMWTEGECSNLPMRKSYQQHEFIQSDRFLKETIESISYGCMTNTYPVPYMYLEFAQIEGEGIPGNALREVMEGATNYEELAQKYQDAMMAVMD